MYHQHFDKILTDFVCRKFGRIFGQTIGQTKIGHKNRPRKSHSHKIPFCLNNIAQFFVFVVSLVVFCCCVCLVFCVCVFVFLFVACYFCFLCCLCLFVCLLLFVLCFCTILMALFFVNPKREPVSSWSEAGTFIVLVRNENLYLSGLPGDCALFLCFLGKTTWALQRVVADQVQCNIEVRIL